MNKKLFLKLVLLLLSLSLIACGQGNNSAIEGNSSKSSANQSVSSTKSSVKESVKTTSPYVENAVQTSHSAAISKSSELLVAHPEDYKAIDASLAKVLAGE